jgi:hypothetical protein
VTKETELSYEIEHLRAIIRCRDEKIESYEKYLNFWFKKHQQITLALELKLKEETKS